MSNISLSASIKNKSLDLGYDLCGFAKVDSMEEYASHLDERIRSLPDRVHYMKASIRWLFHKKMQSGLNQLSFV